MGAGQLAPLKKIPSPNNQIHCLINLEFGEGRLRHGFFIYYLLEQICILFG
jgi:hypothetical protein